jgi:hypothetical protein
MGYYNHHAIIVTSWDPEDVAKAHALALETFPPQIVTPIMGAVANGGASFAIVPDGSKEGWAASDVQDAKRAAFMDALDTGDTRPFVDAVEVSFDEEGCSSVVRTVS